MTFNPGGHWFHAGDTLRSIDCNEPEILTKLHDLKPDKANGPDGFLPGVLKAVADGLAPSTSLPDLQ